MVRSWISMLEFWPAMFCVRGGASLLTLHLESTVVSAGQRAIWAHGKIEFSSSACKWNWQVRSSIVFFNITYLIIICTIYQQISSLMIIYLLFQGCKVYLPLQFIFLYSYFVLRKDDCYWTHESLEKDSNSFRMQENTQRYPASFIFVSLMYPLTGPWIITTTMQMTKLHLDSGSYLPSSSSKHSLSTRKMWRTVGIKGATWYQGHACV